MATTKSNHKNHHQYKPKFLYLDNCVPDQKTSSPDNFDTIKFDIWNTNNNTNHQQKTMQKTITASRKIPNKPHQCHNRPLHDMGKSLPVDIPDWSKIMRDCDHVKYDDDDNEDDWLPPHEYLARVRSASFSVHEGVGRTLKGRDLSRLRNAIWKQTGFE
ncbi:Senescence regulator [Artemisia annua]|uniref:Senescence regulator n=1 Tax=Artemisia annua TaxID=35608 RepID=A0A2U1KXJ7_ARTAN|nr:Senescence regulator [Artemisia annua]